LYLEFLLTTLRGRFSLWARRDSTARAELAKSRMTGHNATKSRPALGLTHPTQILPQNPILNNFINNLISKICLDTLSYSAPYQASQSSEEKFCVVFGMSRVRILPRSRAILTVKSVVFLSFSRQVLK
jgi:hypothetical protein